jgi:hypothetical protein
MPPDETIRGVIRAVTSSPRTPIALLSLFALAALGGGAYWLLATNGAAADVAGVGRSDRPEGPAGPLPAPAAAGRVGRDASEDADGGVARATYDAASDKPFLVAGQVLDDRGRPVAGARVAVYRRIPTPSATGDETPSGELSLTLDQLVTQAAIGNSLVTFGQQPESSGPVARIGDGSIALRLAGSPTTDVSTALRFDVAQLLAARLPNEAEWAAAASARSTAFALSTLPSGPAFVLNRRVQLPHIGSEPTAVRPVVGADDDEEDAGAAALTDADGRFEIRADLSDEDSYSLRASGDCCLSAASQPFSFGAREVVVRTDCWAALAARVELGGRRLAGRDVRVRVVDADCVGRTAYESGSGRDGLFRADGLAEGTATVEVYVHGGAEPLARVEDVKLEAGRCTLDPRLDPLDLDVHARRVRVRVADLAGRPVPGANVRKVTPRLDAGGAASAGCRLLVSEGVLGASGVRTDRDGIAEIVVRRTGDHLAVSCDGFISVRLDSVRDDAAATLRRYRVAEVGWMSPPELAAAAEHHAAVQPWWDALVSFQPAGGGEGWSATFQSEDAHRFFCETAGRITVAFRVHAGVENLPYDVVETLPWQGGADVADVDEPQRIEFVPPSRAEIASVLVNLESRLERLRSQ